MPKCAVKRCRNYTLKVQKKDGVSYFHFPQNEIQKEKWRRIIARDRQDKFYKPNASSVICSEHFNKDDIYLTKKGFKRILKTAIPNIKPMESRTVVGQITSPDPVTENLEPPSTKLSSASDPNTEYIYKMTISNMTQVNVPEEVAKPTSCFIREEKEETLQDIDPLASSSEVDNAPAQDHLLWISAPAQESLCTVKVEIDEEDSSNQETKCNAGSITTTENLPSNISIPAQESLCTIKEEKEEDNTSTHQTECNAGPSSTQNLSHLILPNQFPQPIGIKNKMNETTITGLYNAPSSGVLVYSMVNPTNLITTISNPASQPSLYIIQPQNCFTQATGSSEEASTSAKCLMTTICNPATQPALCILPQYSLTQATGSSEEASTSVEAENLLIQDPRLPSEVFQRSMETDASPSQSPSSSSINTVQNIVKPISIGATPKNTFSNPYEINRLLERIKKLNYKLMLKNKKIKSLQAQIRRLRKERVRSHRDATPRDDA